MLQQWRRVPVDNTGLIRVTVDNHFWKGTGSFSCSTVVRAAVKVAALLPHDSPFPCDDADFWINANMACAWYWRWLIFGSGELAVVAAVVDPSRSVQNSS